MKRWILCKKEEFEQKSICVLNQWRYEIERHLILKKMVLMLVSEYTCISKPNDEPRLEGQYRGQVEEAKTPCLGVGGGGLRVLTYTWIPTKH